MYIIRNLMQNHNINIVFSHMKSKKIISYAASIGSNKFIEICESAAFDVYSLICVETILFRPIVI